MVQNTVSKVHLTLLGLCKMKFKTYSTAKQKAFFVHSLPICLKKNLNISLLSKRENLIRYSAKLIDVCKKLPLALNSRQSKYSL